jgi:hypothetical protein
MYKTILVFLICLLPITPVFAEVAVKETPMTTAEVTISFAVPDLGWQLKIREFYQLSNEVAVVSVLSHTPDVAGMAIGIVMDSVTIPLPKLPIKHYVIGKTWNWENPEKIVFIKDLSPILKRMEKEGKPLWRRKAKTEK